nr:uncharacterized protein LOC129385755 [Dermacentor andersoni]
MTKENLHALCPSYSEELVGPTRARYRAKIEMCDGIDPYELCIGKDATPNVDLLPTVTHADIVNYLVLSTSHVTLQQMKAYKSLEGHNYFTSGWVKSIAAKQLASERVIVLSEVNHSQRLREVPLKVWILAKADGTVGTAHCTCMAGVGEACSHVAATLFAIETAVRLRDSVTCTEKKNTWLPAHSRNVEFRRLREIDFSSSKAKKKKMDNIINSTITAHVTPSSHRLLSIPAATDAELEQCFSAIADAGVTPALFTLHEKYSSLFHPPRAKEPLLLRTLMCEEAASEDLPALVSRAEEFLKEMVITEDMVQHVEAVTREQSKCAKWFAFRAGRVTASVMKSVCRTNVDYPSISLLRRICYPEKNKFSSEATDWGLKHESAALSKYQANAVQCHNNVTLRRAGVCLSAKYPHLAASPDAIVSCLCCGEGIVEVKCPYSLAVQGLEAALSNKDFCLEASPEGPRLKRTHEYFYQAQTQLAMCTVKYCDFVVWTPTSVHIERIVEDCAFFQGILELATRFFTHVVLPEMFSQYFTRKDTPKAGTSAKRSVYCYCRGPETGRMVACDGEHCPYKWFHYSCIGMKRAPKQKHWYCADCAQLKKS